MQRRWVGRARMRQDQLHSAGRHPNPTQPARSGYRAARGFLATRFGRHATRVSLRAKKMLAESGENLSTAPRRIQSVCARPHASLKNPRPQPNTSYTTVYARKAPQPQGVPMQRRRVSRMLKPINPGLNRSFIVCAGRGVKGLVEFSIGVLLRITQVTAVVRTSTAPGTRSPRRVQ